MKNFVRLLCILFTMLFLVYLPSCKSSTDSKPKKKVVSFQDVWFSNGVDNDGDGYYSYARLNFDLDVSTGSVEVFVQIGVRVTDPMDTATYYLYMESTSFVVSGSTTDDAVYVSIGDPNDELPEGDFDFLIRVIDASDTDKIWADLAAGNDDNFGNELTAVPLEESFTDAGLVIYDVYWEDEVDNDGDNYVSEAYLVIDVDVNVGNTSDFFLRVYYKSSGSGTYSFLTESPVFTATGTSGEDAAGYLVDDFPHGMYDFMVEVYYDGGYYVEDVADPSSDSDLDDYQLELAGEDIVALGGWLYYDDGSYETSYSLTSPSYRAVRFNKPAGAVTCSVKEIYLYVVSRTVSDAYAEFKIWNSFNNYPNTYIYNGLTDVFIAFDGNNYYQVDVDVSAYSVFYAGYYQLYGYGFYIGADTSYPDSRSYHYETGTSTWVLRSDVDFAIQVYVEYTVGKDKNSLVTVGEWLSPAADN